ncbi:unnamed protein product [Vitrella brassicaformis CCMP3155]|uniref:Uncharacterized protein n=1 Tax=Vitrella brassicaformis (strain CCMP3155) TaxID=1169540 RepID=A0A0G4GKW7_VITBC|nr:unnamed protein product [Vitrella brassicaformis CCMP3155]|eukprot:CEM30665.1 unnamed protein product [Vitrella brassicaformis CCMP3155]
MEDRQTGKRPHLEVALSYVLLCVSRRCVVVRVEDGAGYSVMVASALLDALLDAGALLEALLNDAEGALGTELL